MKTILCYGDSNTWGNVPRSDDRYPREVRWPGALQDILGREYEVVSEGLCGRTLVAVDPEKPYRTGITHLQAILESADPIDLAIVMLGTNDAKATYGLEAEDIAAHLDQTVAFIQGDGWDCEKTPRVLVVCPPAVIEPTASAKSSEGQALDARMSRAPEIFKKLPGLYRAVAEKRGCGFIDAQDLISSSAIDGYHLDPEAHAALAKAVGTWIKGNI